MKQLILGGARSGKSLFAENIALAIHADKTEKHSNSELIYVATSPKIDGEMNARIEAHKARRGGEWQTIEKPINIADCLQDYQDEATILVDCLTLWLNNLIYENLNVETYFEKLTEAIEASNADIIFVSNELGMGLVPEEKLSREFRDFQGILNQKMAQKVNKVAFIVAGLPLWVK
ncbi:MAG: bifunctional adenosylcobinamide kinase/adenosylcobinamide-phosphate guanylyltransferase [Hyphomicrobiales bacterium]